MVFFLRKRNCVNNTTIPFQYKSRIVFNCSNSLLLLCPFSIFNNVNGCMEVVCTIVVNQNNIIARSSYYDNFCHRVNKICYLSPKIELIVIVILKNQLFHFTDWQKVTWTILTYFFFQLAYIFMFLEIYYSNSFTCIGMQVILLWFDIVFKPEDILF